MSDARQRMDAALREMVLPALRARGFTGTLPHLRRDTGAHTQLLTFQFDKWGGGFLVLSAAVPAAGLTLPSGQHVPASKASAYHVADARRLAGGRWFRYDGLRTLLFRDPYARAARQALAALEAERDG